MNYLRDSISLMTKVITKTFHSQPAVTTALEMTPEVANLNDEEREKQSTLTAFGSVPEYLLFLPSIHNIRVSLREEIDRHDCSCNFGNPTCSVDHS